MTGDYRELAEEYAVGLLTDAEAAGLEAAMRDDADLARAVAQAIERFVEIDLSEPPVPLAGDGWARIAAGIDAPETEQESTVTPFRPRPQPVAAPVQRFWKPAAQAGIAASLLLTIGLGWSLSRPEPQPDLIAVLVDANGEPQAIVDAFLDDSVTVRPLERFQVPEGRTLQVWTLPDVPEAKPVSLGLLDDVRQIGLVGPDLPPPKPGQLYEITIEQAGGSPTGLPTGPIVGKGFAKPPL